MFPRPTVVAKFAIGVFCSAALLGQQQLATSTPATSTPAGVQEFPVILQQNVAAGKTPAGTRIEAKLEVPTLVNGTVIPRDAVFSGEVIESVAKTATNPSRLALRMDSVKWKNGSASVRAYLTAWYYPERDETGQDLQYGPQQPANRTWDGQGQYPDPNSKVYKPFPGSDSGKSDSAPNTPVATTANHPVRMKDVETASSNDGAIAIVCKRANLKLDKLTTYVFEGSDLLPAK
jgi:hypothetical protein